MEHLGNPNANNYVKPNECEQVPNDVEMKNIEDKTHGNKNTFLVIL